jgi:hypothetical protein
METFEYKVMVTYKEKVGAYQRVFFIKVWQLYYLRLVSVHLLQVQVTLSHCVRTIPLLFVN